MADFKYFNSSDIYVYPSTRRRPADSSSMAAWSTYNTEENITKLSGMRDLIKTDPTNSSNFWLNIDGYSFEFSSDSIKNLCKELAAPNTSGSGSNAPIYAGVYIKPPKNTDDDRKGLGYTLGNIADSTAEYIDDEDFSTGKFYGLALFNTSDIGSEANISNPPLEIGTIYNYSYTSEGTFTSNYSFKSISGLATKGRECDNSSKIEFTLEGQTFKSIVNNTDQVNWAHSVNEVKLDWYNHSSTSTPDTLKITIGNDAEQLAPYTYSTNTSIKIDYVNHSNRSTNLDNFNFNWTPYTKTGETETQGNLSLTIGDITNYASINNVGEANHSNYSDKLYVLDNRADASIEGSGTTNVSGFKSIQIIDNISNVSDNGNILYIVLENFINT